MLKAARVARKTMQHAGLSVVFGSHLITWGPPLPLQFFTVLHQPIYAGAPVCTRLSATVTLSVSFNHV